MDKYPRRYIYILFLFKFIYSPTFSGLSIRPSSGKKHNYVSGKSKPWKRLERDDVTKFDAAC
jgi:hypothetical protein